MSADDVRDETVTIPFMPSAETPQAESLSERIADASHARLEAADTRSTDMATTPMNTIENMTAQTKDATHQATEQGKAALEAMTAQSREMMEQVNKAMTEMQSFSKGNLEAMVASVKAMTEGAQTLAQTVVEHSRKSYEDSQAAMKTMSAIKTPNELMTAQNDFAKAQFDAAVAGWSKMTETFLKVAGEVAQPISNRMAVASDSVKGAMTPR